MANSSLALYIRTPKIDYGDQLRTAAALRASEASTQGAEMQNQLASMRMPLEAANIQDQTAQASALRNYRTGAAAGDPNAMASLSAYPELQGQITDAISHLDEGEQHKALLRGQSIGRAALTVAALPVGERAAAWDQQIEALKKNKIIGDTEYQQWKGKYSELALNQAISLGRTFDQLITDRQAAASTAATSAARDKLTKLYGGDATTGDASQPRGIRNNNPLNIEAGRFAKGADGYSGSDGRFAQFETMEQGITAADRLLQGYGRNGISTISGVINRWAPEGDGNDVSSYANSVAKDMGIGALDKIDLSNPETRKGLIRAMAKVENGTALDTGVQTTRPPSDDRRATLIDIATDPALGKDFRDFVEGLLKDEVKTGKGASYEDLSADDKLKIEEAARKQVEAGIPQYAMEAIAPDEMQKQIDAARETLIQKLFGENEQNIKRLTGDELSAGPEAYLKAHPETAAQYDEMFGAGASDKILKGS